MSKDQNSTAIFLSFFFLLFSKGASAATFTFINRCSFTVWPGILAGAGTPKLDSTGFELARGSSRSFEAPPGWSGRFWGRTGCNFDDSRHGSCSTADCGTGEIECNGAGASPPATLAEFTLGSSSASSQDFYDVSLVDGYNLPVVVEASGGAGDCGSTGCVSDLNRRCPAELSAEGGGACRSACEAFGSPEYCCSGAYGSPATCKPTVYSEMFKSACPKAYSYAYDDSTSTFTCTGADYAVTFCPNSPSLKSSNVPSQTAIGSSSDGSSTAIGASSNGSSTTFESGSDLEPAQAAAMSNSWLASLATVNTTTSRPCSCVFTIFLVILFIGL